MSIVVKVYLVGGAVRDKYLNIHAQERDYVVVGATPDALLAQGYQQVGSHFPVFLHPKTREEYALARLERKTGAGYYGFSCHASPDVTLEEDLARRDLTINAMAMDENGQLIDPYGGLEDLRNKCLRHVSEAFVEDPVRVLRVARFAARFHALGFTIAPETRKLMASMVRRGELQHLVPERVWQEWQRSLGEKNPECFITTLRSCGALRVILPEIDALFGVPNSKRHHPEIDSGIHTLLVLQAACGLSDNPMVRFSALMHDLGKARTPMKAWPKHHGHEEMGVSIIKNLCTRLRIPTDYRNLAVLASRFHLNIHRLYELRADTIVKQLEKTDAFRRKEQFLDLLVACAADSKGRGDVTIPYPQRADWITILEACYAIKAQVLVDQGHSGKAIKEGLHHLRVQAVEAIQATWSQNEKQ
jgi:tRNA nucleotidyltransferase (CCA-adding enzyme)